MQRKFLNARSPLRLLEKNLHGGLGSGNVGLVLAAPGVGKSAFLVCVALDEILRGGRVLHVCEGDTLAHVRAQYDTIFEDLATTTQLQDGATAHADIDRRRSIRVYPAGAVEPARLREAAHVESEAGAKPSLILIEGLDGGKLAGHGSDEVAAMARECGAEVWISAPLRSEGPVSVPPELKALAERVQVVLGLEPDGDHVVLRALKDHDNPDVDALRVALDPRTLLLVRG